MRGSGTVTSTVTGTGSGAATVTAGAGEGSAFDLVHDRGVGGDPRPGQRERDQRRPQQQGQPGRDRPPRAGSAVLVKRRCSEPALFPCRLTRP